MGDDLLMDLLVNETNNRQRVKAVVDHLGVILGRKLVAAMPRYSHLKTPFTAHQVLIECVFFYSYRQDVIQTPAAHVTLVDLAPEVNNNSPKTPKTVTKRKHAPKPPNQQVLPVAGPSGGSLIFEKHFILQDNFLFCLKIAKIRKVESTKPATTIQITVHQSLQPKVVLAPLETKEDKESTAQLIYNRLVDVIQNVNPIFAAFKASELAVVKEPITEMGRYIERALTRAEAIVTTDVNWQPPAFSNTDQSNIFEAVKSKFLNATVQFLVSSLPHVEPAYLEKVAVDLKGKSKKLVSKNTFLIFLNFQVTSRGFRLSSLRSAKETG